MFLFLSGALRSISVSEIFKSLGNWSSVICRMLHPSCTHVHSLHIEVTFFSLECLTLFYLRDSYKKKILVSVSG